MYDYWYWLPLKQGRREVVVVGAVERTRFHKCDVPAVPEWVKDSEPGPLGLWLLSFLNPRHIENPLDLETGDEWTCPHCGALFLLVGSWHGGGDL